jgi:flavin-binding protein dodecin
MTHLKLSKGFDLNYTSADKAAKLFLCVGAEDNRVEVTGTTPLSRQSAVLQAIDENGKWAEMVPLWMVAEKDGKVTARTAAVNYKTHVKPYFGDLTISGFSSDDPAMTYPGNGYGRVLSVLINDCYYFHIGGALETENKMRGFDCTTFPLALFGLMSVTSPGYGKQLCDDLGAVKCELELLKHKDLLKKFEENVIPFGYYVLFSEGHVMLYDSFKNILLEFNTPDGFRSTPAAQRFQGSYGTWWMRKLSDDKGTRFM